MPEHPDRAARQRADAVVAPYLRDWKLTAGGDAFTTPSSVLKPAWLDGAAVMLKVATLEEEERGNELMMWWHGRGAARVLRHKGSAILLERATGTRSLIEMAQNGRDAQAGQDAQATAVLCAAAATLHAAGDSIGAGNEHPPPLMPLRRWFAELFDHAAEVGGEYATAAEVADALLDDQREIVVLHGDLHHGNVLDFGERGWLAIDPKHVTGDRTFDYANILCNPDAATALAPGILESRVEQIGALAQIERPRLLRWIVASGALSSAWNERAGMPAGHPIEIARRAALLLTAS